MELFSSFLLPRFMLINFLSHFIPVRVLIDHDISGSRQPFFVVNIHLGHALLGSQTIDLNPVALFVSICSCFRLFFARDICVLSSFFGYSVSSP